VTFQSNQGTKKYEKAHKSHKSLSIEFESYCESK
jgi:hypothetical protein